MSGPFSKWCLLLSQRISRVSKRFVIFPFFVKLDRSGPVLFKQQAPIYPMKVKTLSRWCLVLSEGILMVSERLVVFRFFVNFDRSGPAIILCFCAIMECVTYHQECSQSTQDTSRFHQDGGYHSWNCYGWFLIGLLIFDFS